MTAAYSKGQSLFLYRGSGCVQAVEDPCSRKLCKKMTFFFFSKKKIGAEKPICMSTRYSIPSASPEQYLAELTHSVLIVLSLPPPI